jgi:hypothetical protein
MHCDVEVEKMSTAATGMTQGGDPAEFRVHPARHNQPVSVFGTTRSPTILKNRTESGRSIPHESRERVGDIINIGCRHRLPRAPAVARTSSTVRRMYGETDPFLCSVSPG